MGLPYFLDLYRITTENQFAKECKNCRYQRDVLKRSKWNMYYLTYSIGNHQAYVNKRIYMEVMCGIPYNGIYRSSNKSP